MTKDCSRMGEVRVVPSGKVYRQIFDAEVQLVRTLGETRRKSLQHGVAFDSGRIPIVRNLDTQTGEILSHRQRTWMEGLLNDGSTENPVLYRDAALSAIKPKEVVEINSAVREVKGLPDVIVPAKIGSSIIQYLTDSKQQQHETAVMKLEQGLVNISGDLENQFSEAAEHLLQKMEEYNQNIHQLFSKIENSNDVSTLTFESLKKLWEAIMKVSLQRREWIKELDRTYNEYEKERVKQITGGLKDCLLALEKIAYLPPDDIYRFIDKEAMLVNQALLANHRAMNKLYVNLIEADLKQEMSDRLKWNTYVQDLKVLKEHEVLQKFKDFLARDWTAGLATDKAILMKEQLELNNKRIQLLENIVKLKPPECTKASLTEWYDSLKSLNQEIDSLHIQYIDKLQAYFEKLYHDWMIEIDRCKEELLSLEMCTKQEAEQLIVSDFLPLVGNLQRQFEEKQSTVDKHLERLAQQMDFQCKILFMTCKEAANLWEVHEMNLADQEQQLKEELDKCCKKHEKTNLAREAHLDLLIDQLRQKNTPMELKTDLKKVNFQLECMKKEYENFYQKQLKIVNNYPSMARKQLHRFSTSISKHFQVIEIYKPEKPKKIMVYPLAYQALSAHEDISENVSEYTPEESARSQSAVEELQTDQSVILEEQSEEEAELFEHVLNSSTQALSMESVHYLEDPEGSRNTSYQTVWESSAEASEQLSEDMYVEEEDFFPEEQSDAQDGSDSKYEHFRTSKGNTYSVLREKNMKDSLNLITFLTEFEDQKHLPDYMKNAFLPETMFLNSKKRIRLNFFDHLEDWYDKAMENIKNIAMVKKKEFKAELDLRIHLHKPRGKRIKMDVLHVRAAELRLHSEKVDRHCKGMDEALKKLKNEFAAVQAEHCKSILKFRESIYVMEDIFRNATKSDRLFADGGNYTPTEIGLYRESVADTAISIAKTEGTIMIDLEVMEALSLEQATEAIKAVEDKFLRFTMDLIFIEKIKRFLTNTQARIKSEVSISNYHTLNIASHLEQFERKIDACARPNLDKEIVTPEELYHFSKVVRDLMEKRAIYLNCLVDPALTEIPLQGPIATATRVEFQKQESKVGFSLDENVLQPSKKGKNVTDDAAIGVIKEILQTHKSEVTPETTEVTDAQSIIRGGSPLSSVSVTQSARSQRMQKSSSAQPGSVASAIKYSKPNRFDLKYQVFGETAEESVHFKGIIKYILWESTGALLAVAEDYYKKKDRTPVFRREYLKDTFEKCAEELIQKMLSYQAQTDIYYSNCLQEISEQLRKFEQVLPFVPHFLIEAVLKEHVEILTRDTTELRSTFSKKLQKLENAKIENKHRLRPIMGHPNNREILDSLCEEEEERQETATREIISNADSLQQCVSKHAKDFVIALSYLSEQLLLEFDNFLTVDDIQTGRDEAIREKITTLIRQKLSGLQHQKNENYTDFHVMIHQDSRSWPGIPTHELSLTDTQTSIIGTTSLDTPSLETISLDTASVETASVMTAKTTLAHLATINSRDDAYSKYKQHFLQQLSQTEREANGQLISVQRWLHGWRDSVQNIKKLYA
ncbi:coiled-coil domain-containing protein 180 isoform X2 [Heptranchias perlo]|uniref:coiled-coil domain-containing protein 180 isoform X2 n=1 Tax=Heptranchias perlo TaxID=212740 RepID=UPI00355AC48F